jgi:hypothetical protein
MNGSLKQKVGSLKTWTRLTNLWPEHKQDW